jgi:hypothetical protein
MQDSKIARSTNSLSLPLSILYPTLSAAVRLGTSNNGAHHTDFVTLLVARISEPAVVQTEVKAEIKEAQSKTDNGSTPRFAYVMLVMKGDNYIPGALVTAYSLRLTGTKHHLVCMITSDVSCEWRHPMIAQ